MKSINKKNILILLLLNLIALALLFVFNKNVFEIEVNYKADNSKEAEIFFAYDDKIFTQDNSIKIENVDEFGKLRARIEVPFIYSLGALRLDLLDRPGKIEIYKIAITGARGNLEFDLKQIDFSQLHDLKMPRINEDAVKYESIGADPYIVFDVPKSFSSVRLRQIFRLELLAILLSMLTYVMIVVIKNLVNKLQDRVTDALRVFDNLASKISEPHTIMFRASSLIIFSSIFLLGCIFVGLKLNQSSIAYWDGLLGITKVERMIDIGTPKGIRSDEWNTQTPWVLNQAQRGLKSSNSNIGGETSAFVANTPVNNWSLLLQPKFWGFKVFDLERAYSFIWVYKIFGLWLSFYLMFLILTSSRVMISCSGAFWVLGSSFVQWWFSSHLPEQLIGFALGVTGSLYLTRSQRIGGIIFGGLLVMYSVSTLLLHVYPAFIVPLAYLGIAILLGMTLQEEGIKAIRNRLEIRLLVLTAALIFITIFLWNWLNLANRTVDLMMSTVYPGRRFDLGGEMPLVRMWYGFFEAVRLKESDIPLPPSNASEAASFLLLFPVALLVINPRQWLKESSRLNLFVIMYCLIILSWMSLPLPEFIRSIMASLGLHMSTSQRAEVGLGIGSIISTIVFASRAKSIDLLNTLKYVYVILFAVFIIGFGIYLNTIDPMFFTYYKIIWVTFVVLLLIYAIIFRNEYILIASIGLFIAPSLTVNPLQTGLSSILNKPVLSMAYEHGHAERDRWAVIGSFVLAQGLKAQGLDVVGGTNFVPNMDNLTILDPDKIYIKVWNRYAHITFTHDPMITTPNFELLGTDHYKVKINICDVSLLKKLGLTRIVYQGEVPLEIIKCLNVLGSDPVSGVSYLRIND